MYTKPDVLSLLNRIDLLKDVLLLKEILFALFQICFLNLEDFFCSGVMTKACQVNSNMKYAVHET